MIPLASFERLCPPMDARDADLRVQIVAACVLVPREHRERFVAAVKDLSCSFDEPRRRPAPKLRLVKGGTR